MNNLRITFLVSAIFLSLISKDTFGIIVGTYNTPPLSMYEDGEQIGMATEAIRDLLLKSGITDYKIVNYPLTRGLVELKQARIDIFYPFLPLEAQDVNLHNVQIGPISKYKLALVVRADNTAEISLDTLQSQTIACERGSLSSKLLTQRNIKIEPTTDKTSCLTMVLGKRVAACAIGILPGMYLAALNSMYDKFRFVEIALYSDVYLLLGASLPPETINSIEKTFMQLKQQQYFEKKQDDYEKKFKIFIDTMK